MKRLICIILILCIFTLSGCHTQNADAYTDPVYFYYPYEDPDLYSQEDALAYEIREGAQITTVTELIQLYFEGPERNDLYSPFPEEGTVLECTLSGSLIRITLSTQFNQLIGLQLTMATSCLALTLLNSKNLSVVEINIPADDGSIARSFSLSRENIVLKDSYVALPAE